MFTEDEVKALETVRNMLSEKWDHAHYPSIAYDLLRSTYFAMDELTGEVICNNNSLDNSY